MNPFTPLSFQLSSSSSATNGRLGPWVLPGMVCSLICWTLSSSPVWAMSATVHPSAVGVETSERSAYSPGAIAPQRLALDFRNSGSSNSTVGGASRLFPDFRGTGRPGNHGSGASRGACFTTEESSVLTLLVPEEAKYGGYTTRATPALWTYVPYVLDADSPITFYLLDENGDLVYETFQVINHEPGILKLDLPSTVTLDVGQVYEWYFMIHCNDPSGTDVASFASGWIERIVSPVSDELAGLSLMEQSNLYANQLIWYDALDILAEGLLSFPNDPQIIDAWTNLLSLPSVRLEQISTEPIRDCCTLLDNTAIDDL